MPQRSPLMQSESSRCDETPCLLWGLDPVFVAFAKLYIRDILAMKESRQMPGIFLYNGHPIKQVDILGTVIAMKERDTFYSYGVVSRFCPCCLQAQGGSQLTFQAATPRCPFHHRPELGVLLPTLTHSGAHSATKLGRQQAVGP
ncbi:CST complex subunit STN1 [Fukomys damarensis]|uniref:CST complex subunit STN1 n=1 Tax=Fukomys damarensis TaxID=885580 RepID=A0A091EAQ4_FUKDA|nr:CST complex subunit STN1 [Fukomys damarensis]